MTHNDDRVAGERMATGLPPVPSAMTPPSDTAERDALAAVLRTEGVLSHVYKASDGHRALSLHGADQVVDPLLDALQAAGWRLVSVAPTESLVNDAAMVAKERFPRVRGWCRTHNDFSWLYEDGSGKCFYAYDVEISGSSCDIEAEAAALDVERLADALYLAGFTVGERPVMVEDMDRLMDEYARLASPAEEVCSIEGPHHHQIASGMSVQFQPGHAMSGVPEQYR